MFKKPNNHYKFKIVIGDPLEISPKYNLCFKWCRENLRKKDWSVGYVVPGRSFNIEFRFKSEENVTLFKLSCL